MTASHILASVVMSTCDSLTTIQNRWSFVRSQLGCAVLQRSTFCLRSQRTWHSGNLHSDKGPQYTNCIFVELSCEWSFTHETCRLYYHLQSQSSSRLCWCNSQHLQKHHIGKPNAHNTSNAPTDANTECATVLEPLPAYETTTSPITTATLY